MNAIPRRVLVIGIRYRIVALPLILIALAGGFFGWRASRSAYSCDPPPSGCLCKGDNCDCEYDGQCLGSYDCAHAKPPTANCPCMGWAPGTPGKCGKTCRKISATICTSICKGCGCPDQAHCDLGCQGRPGTLQCDAHCGGGANCQCRFWCHNGGCTKNQANPNRQCSPTMKDCDCRTAYSPKTCGACPQQYNTTKCGGGTLPCANPPCPKVCPGNCYCWTGGKTVRSCAGAGKEYDSCACTKNGCVKNNGQGCLSGDCPCTDGGQECTGASTCNCTYKSQNRCNCSGVFCSRDVTTCGNAPTKQCTGTGCTNTSCTGNFGCTGANCECAACPTSCGGSQCHGRKPGDCGKCVECSTRACPSPATVKCQGTTQCACCKACNYPKCEPNLTFCKVWSPIYTTKCQCHTGAAECCPCTPPQRCEGRPTCACSGSPACESYAINQRSACQCEPL